MEECTNCNEKGMSLTSFKGDKGDKGSSIVSFVDDPNNPSGQWLVTLSDGSTTILTKPSGGGGFHAWADDPIGTGFTTTPSTKAYLAITNTIAGFIPVLSDFTGKFFKINNPEKHFRKITPINGNYVIAPANAYPINSGISIPARFIDVNSIIEFTVNIRLSGYTDTSGRSTTFSAEITDSSNNYVKPFYLISARNFNKNTLLKSVIRFTPKVTLGVLSYHVTCNTKGSLISYSAVPAGYLDRTYGTWFDITTVDTSSDIILNLKDVGGTLSGELATVTVDVLDMTADAYNPDQNIL